MKIEVDWDRCESHGMCEQAAPDLFRLDDEGYMHVDPEVPAGSEAVAKIAVRSCPMDALKIVP